MDFLFYSTADRGAQNQNKNTESWKLSNLKNFEDHKICKYILNFDCHFLLWTKRLLIDRNTKVSSSRLNYWMLKRDFNAGDIWRPWSELDKTGRHGGKWKIYPGGNCKSKGEISSKSQYCGWIILVRAVWSHTEGGKKGKVLMVLKDEIVIHYSIKKTGSLHYFEVFYHPEFFFMY